MKFRQIHSKHHYIFYFPKISLLSLTEKAMAIHRLLRAHRRCEDARSRSTLPGQAKNRMECCRIDDWVTEPTGHDAKQNRPTIKSEILQKALGILG